MGLKGNCPVAFTTEVPFGALFQPGEAQRNQNQYRLYKDDESRWIGVSTKDHPLASSKRGETELSRWFYVNSGGSPDLEVVATWFAAGQPKQGTRAKSQTGTIIVTEKAVRVSLCRLDRNGPWIYSDSAGKLGQPTNGRIFAAGLYFDDIDWVRGGKTIFACGGGLGGVILQARNIYFIPA